MTDSEAKDIKEDSGRGPHIQVSSDQPQKSLYEQLKEQEQLKEEEFIKNYSLSARIGRLDEDEVEFINEVTKHTREKHIEEISRDKKESETFRKELETLKEAESSKNVQVHKVKRPAADKEPPNAKRKAQIIKGLVVKKQR
ncbi:hypothetical protein MP638_005766 [Amoeboaphelidium occidentale]|nr:hypothetical protein MP638_005766 [Amoeboaphelidium occidentale]